MRKKRRSKAKLSKSFTERIEEFESLADMENNELEDETEEIAEVESDIDSIIKKRNTIDITGLAIQSIRDETSNRAAAAASTAYLGDLIR